MSGVRPASLWMPFLRVSDSSLANATREHR